MYRGRNSSKDWVRLKVSRSLPWIGIKFVRTWLWSASKQFNSCRPLTTLPCWLALSSLHLALYCAFLNNFSWAKQEEIENLIFDVWCLTFNVPPASRAHMSQGKLLWKKLSEQSMTMTMKFQLIQHSKGPSNRGKTKHGTKKSQKSKHGVVDIYPEPWQALTKVQDNKGINVSTVDTWVLHGKVLFS